MERVLISSSCIFLIFLFVRPFSTICVSFYFLLFAVFIIFLLQKSLLTSQRLDAYLWCVDMQSRLMNQFFLESHVQNWCLTYSHVFSNPIMFQLQADFKYFNVIYVNGVNVTLNGRLPKCVKVIHLVCGVLLISLLMKYKSV